MSVKISVQRPGERSLSVKLNPNDDLSKICTELEKRITNMNTLLFAENESSEITPGDEKLFKLKVITDKGNILYLVRNSKPDWRSLNSTYKLDYGCIIENNAIKRDRKSTRLNSSH